MAFVFGTPSGGGSWGDEKIKIPESSKTGTIYSVKRAAGNVTEKVVDVVTAPFNFLAWLRGNWQLAVLGLVAIIVLLKD